MFSKLALIVTSAFALAAVAAPTSGNGGSSCTSSGGSIQCCQSTGPNLGILTGWINCFSLVGGSTCNQQTVCCNDNNFTGAVAIGCTPINIGL